MKLEYAVKKEYNSKVYTKPIFNERGAPSQRVKVAVENVLDAYVNYAKAHSKNTDNNPNNYKIEEIYVVGSGAHNNVINSDLDLMLLAPKLDTQTAGDIKLVLSMIFYNDRTKQEAIDVFVRPKDAFPERASTDVTKYVKGIIGKYNKQLK